jgi:glycosyltransferase involved in cell wall biosynthesis
MKSDRVLILNQFFYPDYVTASVLITQMAEDLAARGLKVDALCGRPKEYLAGDARVKARETHNGVHIRRMRYLQLSRRSKAGRLLNYFSFLSAVALRWPRLLGYGLIVVNTTPPLLPLIPALMNLFFGRKFLFVCYDLYPDLAILMGAIAKDGLIGRVMRFTNRMTYRRASKIVALGGEMKEHMLASGLTGDAGKVEVIPNWYDGDPGLYTPVDANKEGEAFTVVYAGNMGVCQDMDTVMGCAGLLAHKPGIRFEFAGHGAKLEALKERAQESDLRSACFHGYLMGGSFTELLNSADCFIVSLERGMEGLAVPSKTYSYLAAGRPVAAVMSRETDIAEQLEQYDAGCTFENGDAASLAAWIEALAADRSRLARMGTNARRLFEERYRRETCTSKYTELIEEILSGNTGNG